MFTFVQQMSEGWINVAQYETVLLLAQMSHPANRWRLAISAVGEATDISLENKTGVCPL